MNSILAVSFPNSSAFFKAGKPSPLPLVKLRRIVKGSPPKFCNSSIKGDTPVLVCTTKAFHRREVLFSTIGILIGHLWQGRVDEVSVASEFTDSYSNSELMGKAPPPSNPGSHVRVDPHSPSEESRKVVEQATADYLDKRIAEALNKAPKHSKKRSNTLSSGPNKKQRSTTGKSPLGDPSLGEDSAMKASSTDTGLTLFAPPTESTAVATQYVDPPGVCHQVAHTTEDPVVMIIPGPSSGTLHPSDVVKFLRRLTDAVATSKSESEISQMKQDLLSAKMALMSERAKRQKEKEVKDTEIQHLSELKKTSDMEVTQLQVAYDQLQVDFVDMKTKKEKYELASARTVSACKIYEQEAERWRAKLRVVQDGCSRQTFGPDDKEEEEKEESSQEPSLSVQANEAAPEDKIASPKDNINPHPS